MTDATALQTLADKIEAGNVSQWFNWSTAFKVNGKNAGLAYNGSLDAAKAMHEALLHERIVKIVRWSVRYGGTVQLEDMGRLIASGSDIDNNPARAWLLAIIRALIANETA